MTLPTPRLVAELGEIYEMYRTSALNKSYYGALLARYQRFNTALEIAIAYRRTVYDSLYIALAVARDSILVTADDKLANALSGGPLAAHVRSLSSYSAGGR